MSDEIEPQAPLPPDDDGDLPIPALGPDDGPAREQLRRLRHRRKRYTLFLMHSNRRRQQQRSHGRLRAFWFTLGGVLAVILALFATAADAAVNYYQSQLSTLQAMQRHVIEDDSVRIYDMHGTLLYQLQNFGTKHSINYHQIPMDVINATVATEDKNFWTNIGIDPQRIIAAAITDYTSGRIQEGASTITQQLIKQNVLNSNISLDRKIKEAILAIGMTETHLYTKSEIITMYLNSIPYGPDTYGIDAAAHAYFNYNDNPTTGAVAAQQLTLAQSSFLAGIPQNPNTYNPLTADGLANALERQQIVLQAMVAQHYITPTQAAAAAQAAHAVDFLHLPPTYNQAPQFVEYVIEQLQQMVESNQINIARTGLSVYTTLDLPLQQQVQKDMYNWLFGNNRDDYGGYIKNDNVSDAAAVLVQQSTGDLRVLLGSWDPNATQTPFGKPVNGSFDVATQGYRQAGSTFKAIVYATAFQMGWFPAMTIGDTPTIFPSTPTDYKPLDYHRGEFEGTVTLRTALQHSLDIPAVKVLNFDGIPNVLANMQRLGITTYLGTPGLAMALGSLNVRLIDMVGAYATFANYGQRIPPNAIDHIVDAEGNTIYQYVPPAGVQVFTPQQSYLLTNVLSDNQARASDFGICSPLRLYTSQYYQCVAGNPGTEYPVAAKTGTTDNLADDWTLGYTMDYTGGVWVGNNNESDGMYHIDGITGAAPIWYKMMLAAENGRPPTPFPVPQGVVRATYSSNGITSTDWFLANNVPAVQGTGDGSPKLCINLYPLGAPNPWDYCGAQPPNNGKGNGNGG